MAAPSKLPTGERVYTTRRAALHLGVSESSFRKVASEKRRQGVEWDSGHKAGAQKLWFADLVDDHLSVREGKPQRDELEKKASKLLEGEPVESGLSYTSPAAQASQGPLSGNNTTPQNVFSVFDVFDVDVLVDQVEQAIRNAVPMAVPADDSVRVSARTITRVKTLLNGGKLDPMDWWDMKMELDSIKV